MFTSFQKILPRALNKMGLRKSMDAALVCERYRKFANERVHNDALTYTFPRFFRGKTLTVGVTSSAWGQQVKMKEAELLEAINTSLGYKAVERVKTTVHVENMEDATQF